MKKGNYGNTANRRVSMRNSKSGTAREISAAGLDDSQC